MFPSSIQNYAFKSTLVSLSCLFAVSQAFAQDEQTNGYDYLNELRVRADMIPFMRNSELETAAENHSSYLVSKSTATLRFSGHFETPGDPGFTGNQASDRTAAAGYLSKSVGENVSAGQADVIDSIDGLMSAIYHRFGFLGLTNNEIGLGLTKDSAIDWNVYTYNMGNTGLNALCQGNSFSGFGTFFAALCAQDSNFRISADDKAAAENNIVGQNPNIVIWPAQGDSGVPPAFFEESPDPLPDLSVSGYPVSLQFNPLTYTDVTINSFRIFNDVTGSEITNTRLLDFQTDPNMIFSELEFAQFPIDRFDWKSAYRVEVEYDSNIGPGSLLWKFGTRNPGVPIFEYAGDGVAVDIPINVTEFNFYVPPEPGFPEIGPISTSFPGGFFIDTEFVDGNTLGINMFGSIGQQVNFFLNGRTFALRIGAAAEILPDPVLDLSVGTTTEEVTASYDIATELLTIPLLVVDGGDRVGLTLRLLDLNDLTFIFEGVITADESVTDAATFTSSSLLLDVPKLDVDGTLYSLQMQLIDAEQLILLITAAEPL